MSKFIEIDRCCDCPHCDDIKSYCRKESKRIGSINSPYIKIPDWCRLLDVKDCYIMQPIGGKWNAEKECENNEKKDT